LKKQIKTDLEREKIVILVGSIYDATNQGIVQRRFAEARKMAPVLIQACGVFLTPIIVNGTGSQDSRVNRENNRYFVAQAQNNETRSMIKRCALSF